MLRIALSTLLLISCEVPKTDVNLCIQECIRDDITGARTFAEQKQFCADKFKELRCCIYRNQFYKACREGK